MSDYTRLVSQNMLDSYCYIHSVIHDWNKREIFLVTGCTKHKILFNWAKLKIHRKRIMWWQILLVVVRYLEHNCLFLAVTTCPPALPPNFAVVVLNWQTSFSCIQQISRSPWKRDVKWVPAICSKGSVHPTVLLRLSKRRLHQHKKINEIGLALADSPTVTRLIRAC